MADPMGVLNSVLEARSEVVAFARGQVWWLAACVTLGVAAWAAVAGWRRRRAAALLDDRSAFELLPAATFTASPEEVRWFAGQLASVPAASGEPPRRAAASRVQITCDDNRVRYLLEGPGRAKSLLRMPGYEQVEVIATGAGRRPPTARPILFEGIAPAGG